jgi:hypothetical protein
MKNKAQFTATTKMSFNVQCFINRTGYVQHVARMTEMKKTYTILV